ncbi:hypothetical protein H9L10_03460 [Phycicoccus endophyticus]|uniref:Type II toxin-antitoxin system HicA family toxin n=2 Tax=Phycicoccus endophyticus TaxID=1690220 RepID=A0A7G9R6B6_9MICO|nr:hypothetical protein [Phycicoccus endophyticus]NHI19882.1 hypothetical protein [Phycicoccus endophyticus]QNN51141.1 hypothetical protein H9L10_03460 [Phycicoccus endophyticus]GGL27794.1 hypothetical protein GCM10012283_07520 [Phycicoccus endophyticus]
MDKEMRKIAKALERQGFDVRVTKRGHISVSKNGRFVVVFAGTPSDWRSMRNALAAARRAGFTWPEKR